MYNKSKNIVLFTIFILVILLIIFVLVLSVYSSKQNLNTEEYKVSLDNAIYDKEFNYIFLKNDAILKKEWNGNYYLYEDDNSKKYELGTQPILYNKSKKEVTIFGNVHQVFSNGEIAERKEKTIINNISEFQFFKISDRQYLIVGKIIENESFSTKNYLIVSIDKAGNATLLNNELNIKTINPLIIISDNVKFDVANEKLIVEEEKIDLKKINGSTNEYIQEEKEDDVEEIITPTPNGNNNNGSGNNNNNNSSNNNPPSQNSQIYNEIINQIINIGGLVSNTPNKTNLYKNISLRSIKTGASYINVVYSIIDPEDKYLSVYLTLEDENKNTQNYYLSKETTSYRISGLLPNKQYKISMNYIERGSGNIMIADSVMAITNSDPTSIRLTKINGTKLFYTVKMYNEYEFESANVVLTNCEDNKYLGLNPLNIQNALSINGDIGEFVLDTNYTGNYVCLKLVSAKDSSGNDIIINSYHKVKIN